MIRLVLSAEDHTLVEQTRRTRPQLAERCHSVLLTAQGWRVPQIARRRARNEPTLRTWLKAYRSAGLTGLHNTPQSGRPATTGQRVSGPPRAALRP
jgi:transposase